MTIPKLFRQNPIQSMKDFKRGLNEITPKDALLSKKVFHFWAALGAAMAATSLFLQSFSGGEFLPTMGTLGFGIFVGGISGLQVTEYRKVNQTIKGMKAFEVKVKDLKDNQVKTGAGV